MVLGAHGVRQHLGLCQFPRKRRLEQGHGLLPYPTSDVPACSLKAWLGALPCQGARGQCSDWPLLLKKGKSNCTKDFTAETGRCTFVSLMCPSGFTIGFPGPCGPWAWLLPFSPGQLRGRETCRGMCLLSAAPPRQPVFTPAQGERAVQGCLTLSFIFPKQGFKYRVGGIGSCAQPW